LNTNAASWAIEVCPVPFVLRYKTELRAL